MLEYADFYDIAEYGNKNWRGSFTEKEIACNAYEYYEAYKASIKANKCTNIINGLLYLLKSDLRYIKNYNPNDPDREQIEYWISELTKGE